MNEPDPFDGFDPHLTERMERAVGGLRAPDVVSGAVRRGRRQRTQRRIAYGAGGIAAATALVLTASAFTGDDPGQNPSDIPVAADRSTTGPARTSSPAVAPKTAGAANEQCDDAETGWWTKSSAQLESDLSDLLPQGVQTDQKGRATTGYWDGYLTSGGDADYASITLLPPPGVLGPWRTLEEVGRLGPCGGGANEPGVPVQPCDELTGHASAGDRDVLVQSCEEIRSEDGTLVGVVTEQSQQAVVNGGEQPTDQTYRAAILAVPGGGHVEFAVGEAGPEDGPDSVHNQTDAPVLTTDQLEEIITDPVWTS